MPPYPILLLGLVAAYFVAGKLGLGVAFVHPSATPVWAPTGISLAALILFGRRLWPAVAVGAFLVNWTTAGNLWTSAAIATGNSLEAVVGATLLGRVGGGTDSFASGRRVLLFVLLAGFVATLVSPTIGVTALAATGFADWTVFGEIWLTWWLGDVTGNLIVAPLLLLWASRPEIEPGRGAELTMLFLTVAGAAMIAFSPLSPLAKARYPVAHVSFSVLLWAAVRFGPREVATVSFLMALAAVRATRVGSGTFAVGSPNESFLLLDAFLTMMSVTGLFVAGVVEERRQAGRALEQAKLEAEAASRAKDQFLAILGHELRSPLAAIATSAAALGRIAGAPPEVVRLRGILERQTRFLVRLVNGLLDVSRLDSGKVRLRREMLDLAELAARSLESLDETGALRERTVARRLESVHVDADPVRIEQIVSNLLENAVKFTVPGGRIEVTVETEGSSAVLRVRDDGRGIDPKALPRVFDFYAQADDSLDRPHGGLGIGLTIVRRLVELHGGTVEARSEGVGRGSDLVVRLPRPGPAAMPAPPRPPAASPSPQTADRRRVLVVEDYADTRDALREALEALGHSVQTAADGVHGVDLATRWRPHVALVDIGLPGLDGYEVARKIRAAENGREVVLLAVTGYGQPEVRRRALEAGFDDCLVKPVDPIALAAAISAGSPR